MQNLTPVYNANNTAQIVTAVNDLSGGWLFSFVIFIVWLILLIRNQRADLRQNCIVSSFAVLVLSIIGIFLKLISFPTIIVPFSLLMISLFIYKFID